MVAGRSVGVKGKALGPLRALDAAALRPAYRTCGRRTRMPAARAQNKDYRHDVGIFSATAWFVPKPHVIGNQFAELDAHNFSPLAFNA
jgi:hypothetical protein